MRIKDIKINELFETHSGEVFRKILIKGRGSQKDRIIIIMVGTTKVFTEKEFEKVNLFKHEKGN